MRSHSGIRMDLFKRPLNETLITDFFGGVAQVQVTDDVAVESDDEDVDLQRSDSAESGPSPEDTEALVSSEDKTNVAPNNLGAPTAHVSSDFFNIPAPAPRVFTPSLRSWVSLIAIGCIVRLISRSSS
jgi:hypothetical protein